MSHHYIICYDTSCSKRRYHIDKILAGYGERMQLSVYECRLSEHEFQMLRNKLRKVIDETDKLNYYPLCKHCQCRRHLQGLASILDQNSFIVI